MNNKLSGKRQRGIMRTTGLLLMIAVLAAGCSPKGTGQQTAVQPQNKAIKTAKISVQKIADPKEQVADVSSVSQVDIIPKADGQIVDVFKKKGDPVHKGDIIYRIDSKDAVSQKAKSELSLKSAQELLTKSREDLANSKTDLQNSIQKSQTQLDNLQKDLNRLRNDYDAGLASQKQLDQAQDQVNNAARDLEQLQNKLATMETTNSLAAQQSQVDSARLSVQDSGSSVDNYNVRSPIEGVLTDLNAEAGMTVSRSSKTGQVQQLNPLKIKADLTESLAKLVRNKTELVFYSADNPSQKRTARISYLAEMMNTQTKLYPIELEVVNTDGSIKPGSRVQLQLTSEQEEMSLAVPSLSIVREGSDTYVFILKGDQAEKRKVKLGRIKDAYQEVLDGVLADELVVVSGQHQLKDSQKVEVAK